MSNRTAFLLLLAACLAAPVSIHAQGRTVTDDLTLIHGGRNRAETRQRFEFVLPRLVRACSDADASVTVADRLVAVNDMIQEAGLGTEEGGLLGLTNAIYLLTTRVGAGTGDSVECVELWSRYAVLRQGGFAKEETISYLVGMGALR